MIRDVIFSGNRIKWIKSEKTKGCVFCKIAKNDKKVHTKVLFKDNDFMVMLNIFPYNTGHLQVVPTAHVKTLQEMSDRQVSGLFVLVKRCMKMLDKALEPLGFNVGINQGGDPAGASIEHLHVHIVPRFRRDFGFMEIISGTKVIPENLDETYKNLKKHARILGG